MFTSLLCTGGVMLTLPPSCATKGNRIEISLYHSFIEKKILEPLDAPPSLLPFIFFYCLSHRPWKQVSSRLECNRSVFIVLILYFEEEALCKQTQNKQDESPTAPVPSQLKNTLTISGRAGTFQLAGHDVITAAIMIGKCTRLIVFPFNV